MNTRKAISVKNRKNPGHRVIYGGSSDEGRCLISCNLDQTTEKCRRYVSLEICFPLMQNRSHKDWIWGDVYKPVLNKKRTETTCFVSISPQCRLNKGAGWSFPFRTCNMNNVELANVNLQLLHIIFHHLASCRTILQIRHITILVEKKLFTLLVLPTKYFAK